MLGIRLLPGPHPRAGQDDLALFGYRIERWRGSDRPGEPEDGCLTIDLLHGGLHGAGAQVGEAEVQAAFLAFCECLDRKRLCGAERQLHQPATIPRR